MQNGTKLELALWTHLLFVDEPDLYPAEIWSYFTEALYAILSEEDVKLLESKFGSAEADSPSREKLIDLFNRLRGSDFISEMLETLRMVESNNFQTAGAADTTLTEAQSEFDEVGSTGRLKIKGFTFDSTVDGNPMHIWKFSELKLPILLLEEMVEAVISAGYERLFLCIPNELVCKIPDGVPVTVLPKFMTSEPLVELDPDSNFAH